MKIGYFVNTYPAISHVFIRREIHGLEGLGVTVSRYSLRGWDTDIVDEIDLQERANTRYLLHQSPIALILATLRCLADKPKGFSRALGKAISMGHRSDGSALLHFAYLIEACALVEASKRDQLEHIHGHFGTNTAAILLLARLLGGPTYSFTLHGPLEWDSPQALSIDEKIVHSKFSVAITSYTRSQMYRRVAHNQWHKIKYVRCGLDDEIFGLASPFEGGRSLVCVGRLVEQKGQLLLLEAARVLKNKQVDFFIDVIGTGPLEKELLARSKQMGLTDHFRLLGPLPSAEMYSRISQSRGLVLPSFGEGLPMAIMETMALRRPVISTYIAGIPELVSPGKTGWLVPAGDVLSLADAMSELLALDDDGVNLMGAKCQEDVARLHSAVTETAKLKEYFAANEEEL